MMIYQYFRRVAMLTKGNVSLKAALGFTRTCKTNSVSDLTKGELTRTVTPCKRSKEL